MLLVLGFTLMLVGVADIATYQTAEAAACKDFIAGARRSAP
jgi:hypothetical protein